MKGKMIHTEISEVSSKLNESGSLHKLNNKTEKDVKLNKKRKKKRKPELKEIVEEPENKIKKMDKTQKEMGENNFETHNNIDDSDHEEIKEVKVSKEETNKFSGKYLRNSFNSADGFATLQKFITICNHNNEKDLAAEYLQAGGSVLEVLRLLDTSEKKNIHNAATVFSAMHIIIMKILAQYPQSQPSAEEACRHLINTHLASIHSMLSSQGKAKHRKIILKLLAAIVSLGGTLPRELLNHLSFHPQLVDVLVSHSKPTDSQNVRTCFIHFMLAFLIEGNASDIRALLEKRGVLSSIFSGLIYDYSDVVQLVLTTVKKYVLENPIITKTTKLHVFSTPIVQEIVNLYNWKGPKNWPGPKKQKLSTVQVDPEEKEIVINAVHEFLITLLTSNRHGIAFHDRRLGIDSGRSHNQLINTILQSMDKPWEYDKPSELVVKILAACPDLIKPQLIYTEPYLVPRVSKKWVSVIQFISRIINNINVENCIKLTSVDLTSVQLTNAILNLTLPQVVVKNAIIPSIEHDSPLIHHEIINLILVMIKKAESFIIIFETMESNIYETSNLRTNILEHIMKHLPSFESILKMWNKAFYPQLEVQNSNEDERDLNIVPNNHLLKILDLLQAYSEICPEMLLTNIENMEIKPTVLLQRLDSLSEINEEDLTTLKVKALKILLCTNVTGFSPNEEIFHDALSFLIPKVGDKNVLLDLEVRKTINILLREIFEGYSDQIEIWIEGITYLEDLQDRLVLADWIAKIIKRVSKNTEKYISFIHKSEENTGEEIDANKQEDIFNELSDRNIEDVGLISPMLPITSISLLSYAAIESLKKHPLDILANYLSVVLTHTLHCQVSSQAFISLIDGMEIPAQKYLTSWSNNNSLFSIKKPFKSKDIFRIMSKILLNLNEVCKIDMEERQLRIELNDNVMTFTLTSFEVKALLRMVIFYLTQIVRKTNNGIENIAVYSRIISTLLKIANAIDFNSEELIKDCAKYIFKHPVLLQYFKGVYKNQNSAENMITKFLIEICTMFLGFNKQTLISQFICPYQEKFITQIKSAIKKYKAGIPKKELKIYLELIQFSQLNVKNSIEILSEIMTLPKEKFLTLDKSTISIWGTVVPNLVKQCAVFEDRNNSSTFIVIKENLLKQIFSYLIEIKKTCKLEIDFLENSLYEYLFKYPHTICAVDEKTFIALMKSNLTSSTVKILNLLIERNSKFITTFIKYANSDEDIFQQKSFIFSTLSNSLKNKWDQEFLKKLYQYYKSDIVLFLTEGKTDELFWIKENTDAVAYLIETIFDPKLCHEICNIILSNGNKLDAVQEEHIKLFSYLFKKSTEIKKDALKDFVQVLLHVTVTSLKRDSKNITKLNYLCKTLVDSINNLKLENDDCTFEELSKNYSWPQFTRIILKASLKITKEEKETSFLLKALATSCDVAYADNSTEEYVKTIFEMTTSHSEFMNVMLSNTPVKSDLIKLLWILIRKNYALMSATHIPLYLASYNATLSTSDQFILKILQFYENNGINLDDYRPYLYGSAAASHYSVKGDTNTALWRQPSTSQVFDLLVPEIVNNTIRNFPVRRNWKSQFTNTLNAPELLDQVYDPAFYLPVFTYLLAENNLIACHKVIHSGALALAVISCSSTCEQVRLAAFTVISRFYFHLEATSSKEKLLWIHFIDTLRNGILTTELPLENVRLNGFVAIFLARTCLIMTQPLNPLYMPLQAFLMAKPALDLSTIPEFLHLYHSSEIEHQAHRHWILEIIRDGVKTDNDMDVALKCVLFKMLFDFYTSVLSDRITKKLILQVVKSVTKLSKACIILINGYALLPWLITITEHLNKGDIESITYILDIVNNILKVFHETKSRENHHHLMLIKVLLRLKTKFNQNLTVESFKTFTDVLNRSIINIIVCNAVTLDQMNQVIDFSKYLLDDVKECETILQFGCKFVKKKNVESDDKSALTSLHNLVITWYNYVKH